MRLMDSMVDGNSTTGIPQIFHDGAWGTICEAVSLSPNDYTDDITEVRRNSLLSEAAQLHDHRASA